MPKPQVKIKTRDVMPEILELLKREQHALLESICTQMRPVAVQKGLVFRKEAISFSLTILKSRGWVSNPTRGSWSITPAGAQVTLSSDQVDTLGRALWNR